MDIIRFPKEKKVNSYHKDKLNVVDVNDRVLRLLSIIEELQEEVAFHKKAISLLLTSLKTSSQTQDPS